MNKTIMSLILFLFLIFTACESPTSSDSTDDLDQNGITDFIGTISSDLISVSVSGLERAAETTDYEIIYCYAPKGESLLDSFIIEDYYLGEYTLSNTDSVPVYADGSFQFNIPEGNKFTAFLCDTTESFQKVIGLIGLGTGSDSYWETIDTDQFTGDINLGEINSDSALSSVLSTESTISSLSSQLSDTDKILDEALLDDSARYLSNLINTRDTLNVSTTCYTFYNNTPTAMAAEDWLSPGSWSFSGYSLLVSPISGSVGDIVEWIPPSSVSLGDGTSYTDSTTYSTTLESFGDFLYTEFGSGETSDGLLQEVPEDSWEIKLNSATLAQPTFGIISPLSDTNHIQFPHPIIHINTTDTDTISSLDIRWYRFDGSDYYQITEDLTKLLGENIRLSIAHVDTDPRVEEEISFSPTVTRVTPTKQEWHVGENPATGKWAEFIGITYYMNGIEMNFKARATLN